MIKYILKLLFTLLSISLIAQEKTNEWTFLKESDGISVYYKNAEKLYQKAILLYPEFNEILEFNIALTISKINNSKIIKE